MSGEPAEKQEDNECTVITSKITKKGNMLVEIKLRDANGHEVFMGLTIKKGVAKITSIEISDASVIIPDDINVNGVTVPIGSLTRSLFKKNKDIVNITIGKNVTVIGSKAFYKAANLTDIEISGSLDKVGKGAFKGIAENAVIRIRAGKKAYKQMVAMIRESGVGKNIKFKRIK